MPNLHIDHIDHIAASNLARDFGLDLDNEQMTELARHLADHRTSTIDLAVSKIQQKISTAVLNLIGESHQYKSPSWADGCRSAESAVLAITSQVLTQLRPQKGSSKGQVLRAMIKQARMKSAANPEYIVTGGDR